MGTTERGLFPGDQIEDLDCLADRNAWVAEIVRITARRKDVRKTRGRLLLLFHELAAPLNARNLARPWYVPGGVARLRIEAMRVRWHERFGDDAPCEKTIRRHLRALEEACLIVRQAGDPCPRFGGDGVSWARYPDTIHLVTTEVEAEWWANHGHDRIAQADGGCDREWVFRHWRGLAQQESVPKEPAVSPTYDSPAPAEQASETVETSSNGDPSTGHREASHAIAAGDVSKAYQTVFMVGPERFPDSIKSIIHHRPGRALGALAIYVDAQAQGREIRIPWRWIEKVAETALPDALTSAIEKIGDPRWCHSPIEQAAMSPDLNDPSLPELSRDEVLELAAAHGNPHPSGLVRQAQIELTAKIDRIIAGNEAWKQLAGPQGFGSTPAPTECLYGIGPIEHVPIVRKLVRWAYNRQKEEIGAMVREVRRRIRAFSD